MVRKVSFKVIQQYVGGGVTAAWLRYQRKDDKKSQNFGNYTIRTFRGNRVKKKFKPLRKHHRFVKQKANR